MVKATRFSDSVVRTIPESVLGLDTDLRQTIFFQFSGFKKVRIRAVLHRVLLEIPLLETEVSKAVISMQKILHCFMVWLTYENRQSRGIQKYLVIFPSIFRMIQLIVVVHRVG